MPQSPTPSTGRVAFTRLPLGSTFVGDGFEVDVETSEDGREYAIWTPRGWGWSDSSHVVIAHSAADARLYAAEGVTPCDCERCTD